MESKSTGSADKTHPASPLIGNIDDDACAPHSRNLQGGTDGATDVARARWTLLRQVLRQKQADSVEIPQVSVRRFASFDLFSRKKVVAQELNDTSDDQWVEYRSVCLPEYSALLRDNLGPLRVNEVLKSFDNTGNVSQPEKWMEHKNKHADGQRVQHPSLVPLPVLERDEDKLVTSLPPQDNRTGTGPEAAQVPSLP
ncbi:unnamed protein product [Menidia menidia]|uniref:(Atlantic silverside) hypothetical protein n=1 Tax=Menidia menidia TaxID=238744 RepID=A0A8S4BXE8_9TELE|nr:unnamed protein product [Menidia menidia]